VINHFLTTIIIVSDWAFLSPQRFLIFPVFSILKTAHPAVLWLFQRVPGSAGKLLSGFLEKR
jgi:hypothetical protein